MTETENDGYEFELSGGHPALDFANTASRKPDPKNNREYLTGYGRLVTWGVQAGLVSPKDGERLRAAAAERPRAAAAALGRSIALREAIFSLFVAIARGERAPAPALDTVNDALPAALALLRLEAERRGFVWRFAREPDDLAPMLAPVVRSAAELLTGDELDRVRECGADTCSWLFLDRS